MNQFDTKLTFREMYMSDLHPVLDIIAQHDEDDGEAAELDFERDGLDGQFVLVRDETVLGVSGFREVDATDQTYYLSWTYLSRQERGRGIGRYMLEQCLEQLRNKDARKVFVKVSDYEINGRNIYAEALSLYKSLGFELELVNKDFYDEEESQSILGLYLKPETESDDDNEVVADEKPIMRFKGLFEIAETDGAYTFEWGVENTKKIFEKRGFSQDDLEIGLEEVRKREGRKVVLTFPSNLVLIHQPLQGTGFKYVGRLKDYYEPGLHELHFEHDLSRFGST